MLSIPQPESIYNGNYASLPSSTLKPPVEGNRTIPVSIPWLQVGQAPGFTIAFNARLQQTLAISQIAALHIDNSHNHSSMHVAFPDTQFEVICGPNQVGFYPIVTSGLEFFAWIDLQPLAQDLTIIQVLNFLPPPILFGAQPGGSGVGTVTEVDTAAPLQGGPITATGTISLQVPLPITYGGTGGASGNAGLDNLSGSSGTETGTLTRSPAGLWEITTAGAGTITGVTAGNGMQGGGTTGTVSIGINPPVSISNGGTGATSAGAALTALGAAPTASPALTGSPTVPNVTPASTSNTVAANTAFVHAAIANDISLPLSPAQGGTGATTAAAARTNLGAAPIASPTFTGTVTIPATAQITAPNIVGVTDGSSAAAGDVGEYVTANVSNVLPPNNTWGSTGSMTLAAGDWDLGGTITLSSGSAPFSEISCGFSLTSAAGPTLYPAGAQPQFLGACTLFTMPMPPVRVSLTAPTLVYANVYQNGAGTGNATSAFFAARRVR